MLAIEQDLRALADKEKASVFMRFFKTKKGEYGYGDTFLGITVPKQRAVAKRYYKELSFKDIEYLLASPIHEIRLTGLFVLVYKYQKADEAMQKKIFRFYIKHINAANNWDLIDTTVPHIIGHYLYHHRENVALLYTWARSKNLWKRRSAIMATFYFIKNNEYSDALAISELLVHDTQDLIHKAVGWMLREIGNRDKIAEVTFIKKHVSEMPRTMLRYAIEKFSEQERKQYLSIRRII